MCTCVRKREKICLNKHRSLETPTAVRSVFATSFLLCANLPAFVWKIGQEDFFPRHEKRGRKIFFHSPDFGGPSPPLLFIFPLREIEGKFYWLFPFLQVLLLSRFLSSFPFLFCTRAFLIRLSAGIYTFLPRSRFVPRFRIPTLPTTNNAAKEKKTYCFLFPLRSTSAVPDFVVGLTAKEGGPVIEKYRSRSFSLWLLA